MMELHERSVFDEILEEGEAESDPGPANTSALLFEKATHCSEQTVPQIHSSSGESTDPSSPLLAPASKFLFIAYTRVENKRPFNAAANINDGGSKRLTAHGDEILV